MSFNKNRYALEVEGLLQTEEATNSYVGME